MKIVSLLGLMALATASPPPAPDLTLVVRSPAQGGRIAIAIYRDAEALKRGQGAVRTVMAPCDGPVTTARIPDLAPGRYVVAVFHDADADGRLSTWPVGLPKEAYGFSNNARGRFGPPSFDAAAFDLPASGARQTITLR